MKKKKNKMRGAIQMRYGNKEKTKPLSVITLTQNRKECTFTRDARVKIQLLPVCCDPAGYRGLCQQYLHGRKIRGGRGLPEVPGTENPTSEWLYFKRDVPAGCRLRRLCHKDVFQRLSKESR